MKCISTEWGFGTDNIKVLKEIDYITELEEKYLYNRGKKIEREERKNRFKAEMITRGIVNKEKDSFDKLMEICKIVKGDEKYCSKLAKEIKISYDDLLSWMFDFAQPSLEDKSKIELYFSKKGDLIWKIAIN